MVLRLFVRDWALRHSQAGEARELADGFGKGGAGRLYLAIHKVEEADEISALNDETPRSVAIAMDALRPRRARKGPRGFGGRLPPIALSPEAILGESDVEPVEERRIDLAVEKIAEGVAVRH
jgi:hypothetical protein